MKKIWFLAAAALWPAVLLNAQTDGLAKDVQLQEAVVKGARVVSRPDGTLIYPSEEMKNAATSGYNLLRMLPLPNVKVDDVNESIVALNSLVGAVQVRINGVVATADDLRSLRPKEVAKVEFIDRPGVRYGQEVGIVINIVTHRVTAGYAMGADATSAPKADMLRGSAYAKLNRENSEFSINYSGAYSQMDGMHTAERTDYQMADNTITSVQRNTDDMVSRSAGHHVQTRYSMVDAEKSAFLATFSASLSEKPLNRQRTNVAYSDGRHVHESAENSDKVVSPLFDLYWRKTINNGQTFTANATGAYTHTDYAYRFASDNSAFGYTTLGKTWSLRSEAVYENRLRPFTLSAGMRFNQKYVDNAYAGDVSLLSQIRVHSMYAFTQIQGALGKVRYMGGLALSREYYHQGTTRYDKVWLRPKVNLSVPVARHLSATYSFTTAPASSKLQNMSGMAIVNNEMEQSLGNTALMMARRDDHQLAINYQTPRLFSTLSAHYRHNAHPAMQHILRTDDNLFVKTFLPGRRIDMLMLMSYTSYDIVPEHLNAYLSAERLHIINDGQDYSHRLTTYNFSLGLTAWLGRWTLMASLDNGWHFMENEYEVGNILSSYLSASYRMGALSATLFCQNPLRHDGKVEEFTVHNRLMQKYKTTYNRDTSSLIGFKLTWSLTKGRQVKGVERDVEGLKDMETGVTRSGK